MYTNPYSQGGWSNPYTGTTSNGWEQMPPSISGALPSTGTPTRSGFQTFYFTSLNPDILNCVVIGPSKDYIDVITTATIPGPECTTLKKADGQAIALIEWFRHPFVEVSRLVSRRTTGQFLSLSPDRSSRTMEIRGKIYTWVPNRVDHSICLYNMSYTPSEVVARVLSESGSANLQITNEAIYSGLTEAAIVATILLLSDRNID